MDPRVSTAPTPKVKKWVPKTSGGSCLLRQPSGKNANDVIAAVVMDRPQTCPVPALTPQFHWNLNNSALKTLSQSQVNQLYGLFSFYDSSTTGDDLPSINCARLVNILRDARLLSESTAFVIHVNEERASRKSLRDETVERIFAQAVLGKMRVYLDPDGQPALTFPLFCGALMNCAMLLTPSAHPEAALRQILPLLLEGSVLSGHHSAGSGLLSNLPTDGTIALWIPDQSYGLHELINEQQDFRALPTLQQVIVDCNRDKILDELKQERLARHYRIPSHLVASFHPDTIALISNKFRMFDVFYRGLLPLHEVFPLLSSLGKHADLPDPYAVLTQISTPALKTEYTPDGSEAASNGGEMTLAQLLQAIEATREAKRHSSTTRLAAMKINSTRAVPSVSATIGSTPSVVTTDHMTAFPEGASEDDSNNDHVDSRKTAACIHGSSVSKDRQKKSEMPRSRSRKSILSQGATSTAIRTSRLLLNSKNHSSYRTTLAHNASVSGKKKAEFNQKLSSKKVYAKHDIVANPAADSSLPFGPDSGYYSQRSATTFCSSSTSDHDHTIPVTDLTYSRSDALNSECISQHLTGHKLQLLYEYDITVIHKPPSARDTKTLQIFLLLGGDHDGAICCTYSLTFATREIMESEGIHYSNAPSEITRTAPVLPTQKTLKNAHHMLKKCVLTRQEQGFELRPTNQLEAVESMLHAQTKNQPRVSIARSPVRKTLDNTVLVANWSRYNEILKLNEVPPSDQISRKQPSSTNTVENLAANDLTASSSSIGTVKVGVSPVIPNRMHTGTIGHSPLRRQKASPLPKSTYHHQIELPNNYRDLLAVWEVSQGDNCAWIHDVNAASPLKPASPARSQSNPCRPTHLSPLRFPSSMHED